MTAPRGTPAEEDAVTRITILAFAMLLPSVGCHKARTEETPPRPVKVQRVEPPAEEGGLRYSASVQPNQQVQLAFKVGGYVREIAQRKGADGKLRNLQQGDDVQAGFVLARVRETDYQKKVGEARAQRSGAAGNLEKARADMARAQHLYDSQSLTRTDYDAARAALTVAQSQLKALESELASAEIALRDGALRAPLDAVVLSRGVEVGTLASPGTVGFVVADISKVKAVFGVPDSVAIRIKMSEALDLTTELSPTPLRGLVTAIAPSADAQSRVFNVEVTLQNPERRIRPGMIASVSVAGTERRSGPKSPAVPLSSVVRSTAKQGGYAVFVLDETGGRAVARARDVELGDISGNLIAVTQGLRPAERVIVTGATLVSDGERVSVIE